MGMAVDLENQLNRQTIVGVSRQNTLCRPDVGD